MTIAVVDYGIGNLRSAQKALEHLGADAVLTGSVREVERASAVVLPGVGAFGACVRALRDAGLEGVTRDAAGDGRPFLGICVGMQMLFEASDEDPGAVGLGVIAGRVTRLPDSEKLPQIGWNTVDVVDRSHLFAGVDDPAWFYFVHAYAPEPDDPGVVAGWTDYGRRFPAAVEVGPVWATQFHPEKSSRCGLAVLANFVTAVGR